MFIELTKIGQRISHYKILLNSDLINYVGSDASRKGSLVHTSSDVYHVEESYDEIKMLLKPARVDKVVSPSELDMYEEDDELEELKDKIFGALGLPRYLIEDK